MSKNIAERLKIQTKLFGELNISKGDEVVIDQSFLSEKSDDSLLPSLIELCKSYGAKLVLCDKSKTSHEIEKDLRRNFPKIKDTARSIIFAGKDSDRVNERRDKSGIAFLFGVSIAESKNKILLCKVFDYQSDNKYTDYVKGEVKSLLGLANLNLVSLYKAVHPNQELPEALSPSLGEVKKEAARVAILNYFTPAKAEEASAAPEPRGRLASMTSLFKKDKSPSMKSKVSHDSSPLVVYVISKNGEEWQDFLGVFGEVLRGINQNSDNVSKIAMAAKFNNFLADSSFTKDIDHKIMELYGLGKSVGGVFEKNIKLPAGVNIAVLDSGGNEAKSNSGSVVDLSSPPSDLPPPASEDFYSDSEEEEEADLSSQKAKKPIPAQRPRHTFASEADANAAPNAAPRDPDSDSLGRNPDEPSMEK